MICSRRTAAFFVGGAVIACAAVPFGPAWAQADPTSVAADDTQASARSTPLQHAPKLIVTIVVDQFSANLFNQYRGRFTGGLRTLADQGRVYANGYQTHAVTETCPGHSTVLTGAHPTRTGIPANNWIDPQTGREVYCLAAPANTLADGGEGENGSVGPDNLRVTSLGDWLKAKDARNRVFAVSGKDRGAINLAGHHGDGVFWYVQDFGFTTYVEPGQDAAERLAPVAKLNARIKARLAAHPFRWTYVHEDCRALAGDWPVSDGVFHSDLPPVDFDPEDSPLHDELTLEAATDLLRTQGLGRGPGVDLLGVSLSATDHVGHMFGTQGPEMCEQLHRMDEALGAFLSVASEAPGGVLVVLTADHGGSDLPERMAINGNPDAGHVDLAAIGQLSSALKTRFGLERGPLIRAGSGLMIADAHDRALAEPVRSQILEAALAGLNALPDVNLAVSRDALLAEPEPDTVHPDLLTVRQRMRLSAVQGRSPDILIAMQPGLTVGLGRLGHSLSSHGSPWDYDRRVPIIFWAPGAQGQERFWPIRTIDIAPTLAHVVDVAPAETVEGRCLDLGLFGADACLPTP